MSHEKSEKEQGTVRGRPLKFRPEYCERILSYFRVPARRVEYKESYYPDGALKSREPVVFAQEFPTFQGFADEIGVHFNTLRSWAENPRCTGFKEAYGRAGQLQEKNFIVGSMSGQYSASFAQFFAKSCLGYRDRGEPDAGEASKSLEVKIRVVE